MRIDQLRIDAFGQFQRLERELGPELNLFYGPNEAGKSTLLAFVRAVLFGFSRRGASDRYEPEGRTISGELLLNTRSGTFWARRAGSRRFHGELQLRTEDGRQLPPSRLNDALSAISRELFCQVFAFGLHELSSFEELAAEGSVSEALFAAGMLGARRLPFALAWLEKSSKALFASRGSKSEINNLLGDLAQRQQRLAAIGDRPRMYFDRRHELEAIEAQLKARAAARRNFEEQREKLREVERLWCETSERRADRDTLADKARQLEFEKEALSGSSVATLRSAPWRSALAAFDARLEQWRSLEGRRAKLDAKKRILDDQLSELQVPRVAADLAQCKPQVHQEALELVRQELSQAGHALAGAKGRLRSATAARDGIEQQIPKGAGGPASPKRVLPLRWAATISLGVFALGIVCAHLFPPGLRPIALAIAFSLGALFLWSQHSANRAVHAARARNLETQASFLRSARQEELHCTREVESAERHLVDLQLRLRSLLSSQGLPEGISAESALQLWARLAVIQQSFSDLAGDQLALEAEERDCRAAAAALLNASASAGLSAYEPLGAAVELRNLLQRSDEAATDLKRTEHLLSQAREQAARHSRKLELLQQRLQKLAREAGVAEELSSDERLAFACKQRLRTLDSQLSDLDDKQRSNAERKGGIIKDLETWEKDSELAQLRSREEFLRARITDLAEQYAIQRLAAGLIKQARWRYERDQQPRVIKIASQQFAQLTGGRYSCVYTQPDAPDTLFAADAQGKEWTAEQLSRGTREQLYLSFRLAVVQDFAESREPLPLILDDILVNFDPERAQNAVKALARISKAHQVVAFTCHPALRDLFQKHGAHVLSLSQRAVPLLESA